MTRKRVIRMSRNGFRELTLPARRVAILATLLVSALPAGAASPTDAHQLLLTGRYEEAREIFAQLKDEQPVAAALGVARCQSAVGKYEAAVETLEQAISPDEKSPRLRAELARLHFARGDYETAKREADAAIEIDPNQWLARWILAELHRAHGRLDEAQKAYEWFVDNYNNAEKIDDPESLRYIGLAAAQFARWTRNSQQFRFLVNKLYPQALELDENFWPARLEAGLLFLEKYNERDATAELNAALTINPNAAEVHAARARLALQSFELDRAKSSLERALEINPHLLEAHQLRADSLLADFRAKEAIEVLENALRLNPRSEETLGRLAAVYGYVDGFPPLNKEEADDEKDDDIAPPSRMEKTIALASEQNPRCGRFFYALAETLDLVRKYPHAARYYDEAMRRMPRLVGPRGQLGMMYMRLGEEARAKKLLDASFEIDPFNVRVKNTLEVLDVLDTYAVLETEHFVIKFDRGQDEMLAEYAARFLEEEVYPDTVEQLGYEPPGKSLFEIFSRAKNTSGHGWFSARMVGLPYVGTVGACAGKMVAMVSPGDMPEPFNWARVLRHEFVHVVNLQQTDFNIPHWFTEALAVRSEGYPRPPDWTQLIARRQAAGTLFTLDNINHGFLRPGAGDDWTLAYAQSELYADYMIERFGDDAPAKMLAAYGDNLSTAEAIERCFDVEQQEFEDGYREFIAKILEGISAAGPQAAKSFAELEKAAADDPENAELQAELAYEFLKRKSNLNARRHALAALKQDKRQQLACYVLARLYLSIGDTATTVKLLQASLQEEIPQENHLALLAAIYLRQGNFDEAERLYQLGAEKFPHGDTWPKRLASLYLKSNNDEKLAEVLRKLVQLDSDNLAFRQKLAELALARQDFAAAERWAMECLHININNADTHALRAEALTGVERPADAATEYEYALRIDPERAKWRFAMAKSLAAAGDKAAARAALDKLLKQAPDFPGAAELLEDLKK